MKKGLLLGGSSAVLLGLLMFSAWSTQAASTKYPFLVRGIVKEVDTSGQNLNVYITHASAQAQADLSGMKQDFNVKPGKYYKWVNGKKKRINLRGVVVGDEVVMQGVAKTNGTFNVSWVVVNDRSFDVIGKIKENDTSAKVLKVLVGTSTYRQSTYAGQTLVIHYDDNTQFMSLGKVVNNDELSANSQQIKVRGFVNNASTWNATTVWDDYTKSK